MKSANEVKTTVTVQDGYISIERRVNDKSITLTAEVDAVFNLMWRAMQ